MKIRNGRIGAIGAAVGLALLGASIPASAESLVPPLAAVKASARFTVDRFQGARRIGESPLPFVREGRRLSAVLDGDSSHWRADLGAETVVGEAGSASTEARFVLRLEKGSAAQTGITLRIDFDGWTTRNFVMIPGAAYNGNRFDVLAAKYPPFYDKSYEGKTRFPVTITDVPRLNIGAGPSKIELTTGDMAAPAVAVFFPELKKGLLLLFPQQTELGNSGITLEESADRTRASLRISAPAVRERKYTMTSLQPSDDRAPDLREGDAITLRVQVRVFDCPDIPGLYEYFFTHRKDLTGPNRLVNRTPFSEALRMQVRLQNDPVERWKESGGYYKNGNGDTPFGNIQIGWVGGLMQTCPLLIDGDALSLRRSFSTFDVVWGRMAGRSGFLYGMYKDGLVYGDNFDLMEKNRSQAMIRKNADVLHFMVKQLEYLRREGRGEEIKPLWESGTKALAEAFVKLWKRYGEFGQIVDVETGDLVISGSTAGAMAPAALALAARYFKNPAYLKVAEEAAELYFRRDAANGYTTGGPGEILQCPDSESAFALLESFVVLYEATREARWLRYAEAMAGICSSWVVSYDYRFPVGSTMERCGAHSAGAVWASIQNKHSAPGICTTSGDFLLTLYRATGKARYLELLRDIAHNVLEFMSTEKRPVGSDRDGFINERVNLSDWEGREGVGGNAAWGSVSWCELAVMLTAVEIPGIYVRPAEKLVCVFDHLDVVSTFEPGSGVLLKISNATPYPSTFSVFADTGPREEGAVAPIHAYRLPRFDVKPGEEIGLKIGVSGRIERAGKPPAE